MLAELPESTTSLLHVACAKLRPQPPTWDARNSPTVASCSARAQALKLRLPRTSMAGPSWRRPWLRIQRRRRHSNQCTDQGTATCWERQPRNSQRPCSNLRRTPVNHQFAQARPESSPRSGGGGSRWRCALPRAHVAALGWNYLGNGSCEKLWKHDPRPHSILYLVASDDYCHGYIRRTGRDCCSTDAVLLHDFLISLLIQCLREKICSADFEILDAVLLWLEILRQHSLCADQKAVLLQYCYFLFLLL